MNDLIKIRAVVESVSDNIDISEITRKRKFSDARKIYSYISKECTNYSFAKIGKFINRDHATIMHHLKRCQDLMTTDRDFNRLVKHCMLKTNNILDINTSTYKNKVDIFWSNLSQEQQEEIYYKVNEMYANNNGLKKEIHYVS